MAMKIRLARGGTKKRPHYAIVATDSRMPRDGRFLEKLGTYDPLLAKDNENRIKMDRRPHPSTGWTRARSRPTAWPACWKPPASARKDRSNPKAAVPGKKPWRVPKKKAAKAAAPAAE